MVISVLVFGGKKLKAIIKERMKNVDTYYGILKLQKFSEVLESLMAEKTRGYEGE